MSSGMKKIAVGLLFLSVHITIGKLVIFPPVVGAAFLLWGIHDLLGRIPRPRLAVFGLAGGCYNRSLPFLEVSRKGVYGSMDFGGSCPSGVWSVLVSVYQIGNGENWSGDYSRRLFFYSILMTIGITRYIKAAPFWTPNGQLFSAVLMLAARAYLLFAAILEDEEPSKEKEPGMDSV